MSRNIVSADRADPLCQLSTAPSAIARIFSPLLSRFEVGTLVIEFPSGQRIVRRAAVPGPEAVVKNKSWRALRRLLTRGDIGFAEGYLEGDWTTPDLKQVFSWAHANEAALAPAWRGASLQRLFDRLLHARRANTRRGSRRNIAAHYDLGNDFYEAWLDPTMSYSSALFTAPDQSLEEAQLRKLDRVIALMDVAPEHRVLEIGCGWGALAERLIRTRGCHVTGITLSQEQLQVAEKRVSNADRSGLSEILLQDYRDVSGTFDRIVSIEMFEAAGESYWPVYFEKLRSSLAPGGIAMLQVITISEHRFETYRIRPDFIQRYVFPGGMLPTERNLHMLSRDVGLVLDHQENFGDSYAHTLAAWRTRFLSAFPSLRGAVACPRFRNLWEYYLSYCEVGFETKAVDVGLYRLRRMA